MNKLKELFNRFRHHYIYDCQKYNEDLIQEFNNSDIDEVV